MKIESGSGNGRETKVGNNNRLFTDTVNTTEAVQAIKDGDAYNINTGIVSISATTGMLYIKNNEDKDLLIESLVIGTGASSTYNSTGEVQTQIIRNPTTGTLISGASAVSQNANRNFGSSNTLTVTAYKGASGNTITDGTDIILIGSPNAQARTFAEINLLLKKGNSIGVEVNPNLASGSTNCYVAAICHLVTDN